MRWSSLRPKVRCVNRHDLEPERQLWEINRKLDLILRALSIIYHEEQEVMADLSNQMSDLETAVANEETVTQSAVTLIQGLAQQIAAAGTDPAALQALTNQLNTTAQSLADAVAANTPASPGGGGTNPPPPLDTPTDPNAPV